MWKEVDILNVVPLQQYSVMLLFLLFFFFFNFVTQFQEKIEIKHLKTLICFHLFIYFFALQCFTALFVRVVTTLFPDPGFSLTSTESSYCQELILISTHRSQMTFPKAKEEKK